MAEAGPAGHTPRAPVPRPLKGRVVIIGGGLAGLFAALKLAPLPVTLVTAETLAPGASSAWVRSAWVRSDWARSTWVDEDGLAAAAGADDRAEAHALATIAAGAGIVDEAIARLVATDAAARIADLAAFGVPFGRLSGDPIGAAILQALIRRVQLTPAIEVLEGYVAEGLIRTGATVTGAILSRADDMAARFRLEGASAIVLATGGIGGLYEVTTNPPHALGQTIALAARAGAAIADAEFVQFHPAAMDISNTPLTDVNATAAAEHFHMGGVKTDADGRTLVPGLWVIGEAASTGLHGAGCLASNTLLEAVVFAARAAAALRAAHQDIPAIKTTLTRVRADHLPDLAARDTAIKVIRATLTRHAGVVRSGAGLETALETLDIIEAGADGDVTIENAVIAARFIVEAALRRKESRGSHVRTDHPAAVDRLARRSSITLAGLSLRSSASEQMAGLAAATLRKPH